MERKVSDHNLTRIESEEKREERGFRNVLLGELRKRVTEETEKRRLARHIKRLRKYEPDIVVLDCLLRNPHWERQIHAISEKIPGEYLEPDVLFVFRGGGNVPTIPVTDEKRIYFTCGKTIYAIDGVTGQVVWRKRTRAYAWNPLFLKNNIIYAAAGRHLFALVKNTGSVLWMFHSEKHLTGPFADGHLVYAGSHEGTVYCLDAREGKNVWSFNTAGRIDVANGNWGGVLPAVSNDSKVYGICVADGGCSWSFSSEGRVGSLPCVKKGVLIFGTESGKIYSLLASSGGILWTFRTTGKVYATPCEKDGVVYCGSRDKNLYALDLDTGKEIWRFESLGYVSSPAVDRGMVYFSTPGRVYAVSISDHKMRWCFPLGFSVATAPVVEGSNLYTGTVHGQMLGLRLSPRFTEQVAAFIVKAFLNS